MKFSFVILLLLWVPRVLAEELRNISPQESAQHLLKKVDPVYPAMGKQLRIQGDVTIQIAISDTGAVKILNIISGSPLLISAAVEAVQQQHYSPFLFEGRAVAVQTTVTVPFSLGDTPERILELNRKNDLYFQTIDSCRKEMEERRLSVAEETCRKAVALSEELDPARRMERMGAVREMGHAFFLQKKFAEALHYYEAELRIGESFLSATDAELAAAHYHVGNGLWGTGQLEEASKRYEEAESGYKRAANHIESAFLKNEYAKRLRLVLSDHAAMLRQMGHTEEADKLQKEAAGIVVKEGVRQD